VLLNPGRDADAAGFGQAFEAGGDVDAVAEDVAVLDDDVALMDAGAEFHAPLRRKRRTAFGQSRLHLRRASESVGDARELHEQPVAAGLDDAAAMAGDFRIEYLDAECFHPAERAFLIGLNEARITGDIGRKNQTTFCASWPCGLHGASLLTRDPTLTGTRRA